MGWINTARYKWAELMGNEIKFKPATFYLGIADHLAKAVEGLKQEDMTEETGEGDRRTKRGHGELLDATPPVETEEGLVELPSTEKPGGKGKDKGPPGLATSLDPSGPTVVPKHHGKVPGVPLPPTLDSAISNSPPRKHDANTPLPEK